MEASDRDKIINSRPMRDSYIRPQVIHAHVLQTHFGKCLKCVSEQNHKEISLQSIDTLGSQIKTKQKNIARQGLLDTV